MKTFVALCLLFVITFLACAYQANACTTLKTNECPRLLHKVKDDEVTDSKRLWVKTQFGVVNISNKSDKCKKAMKDYICAENYTKCDLTGTFSDVCRSVCEARANACGLSKDDCKNLPLIQCSGRVGASSATTTTVSISALAIVAIATLINAMF